MAEGFAAVCRMAAPAPPGGRLLGVANRIHGQVGDGLRSVQPFFRRSDSPSG